MGVGCSNLSLSPSALPLKTTTTTSRSERYTNPFSSFPLHFTSLQHTSFTMSLSSSSISSPLAAWRPGGSDELLSDDFLDKVMNDALIWSALHGLVVGDRSNSVLEIFCFHFSRYGSSCSESNSLHLFLDRDQITTGN